VSTGCDRCGGFGWRPLLADGTPMPWDGRDLGPLLDSTRAWERCGCRRDTIDLGRLQASLARLLLARINEEVGCWLDLGDWRRGTLRDGRTVLCWRDLALLTDDCRSGTWTLASDMGVLTDLSADALGRYLRGAGAPALPG
jgi:hypothetical protein